jgi:hypothetical protein
MLATVIGNASALIDKVNLLSGASLSGQPAQGGQASASSAVATNAKSMGASAAAGRRLKAAFRHTILRTPLKSHRVVYVRQNGGMSYSPHTDSKFTD